MGQRAASFAEPRDASVALLQAGDFLWLGGEGRGQHQQAVAGRHVVLPVAAVQRFGPHQGRRMVGAPRMAARTGGNATHRDAVSDRQLRYRCHATIAQIENTEVLGEALPGGDVGVRTREYFHQHVAAVRRRVDGAIHGLGAHRRHCAGVGVDHRQLRRGVVVEQGLVLGTGQGVARFVRAALALASDRFLDLRARRDRRARRRGTDVGGHPLHEQRGLVAQPLHSAPKDGVELQAFHAADLTVGSAPHPQLNAGIGGVVEREARAVGRPRRRTRACARGQHDWRLPPAGQFQHAEPFQAGADAVAVGAIVAAVVPRLDPHARQLQIRLGHAGNGRVLRLPDQDRARTRGVQRRRWIERCAEHLQERLGRLQVSRLLRRRQRRHRQGQSHRQQHPSFPHHPPPLRKTGK